MGKVTDRQMAKYGILLVGSDLPQVQHFVPDPVLDNGVCNARLFVDEWVNRRVDHKIARGPIVHVFDVRSDGKILADTTGVWFDYGHFSVLGTNNGFDALWRAACASDMPHEKRSDYCTTHQMSKDQFRRLFKPRPLANATLVVTADDKMLCVRRGANMHLHPRFLHCNGGKVAPVKAGESIDLRKDALKRVCIETGIPLDKFEQPTYIGLCHNDPFDEVIALFTVQTSLTAEQVTAVYARAQEPDGGVEWYNYELSTLDSLRLRRRPTPSFRALLLLEEKGYTARARADLRASRSS